MYKKILLLFIITYFVNSSAQNITGFESGIPLGLASQNNKGLSISEELYKEGNKSLKWEFNLNDSIELKLDTPIILDKKTEQKSGTTLWIYNETEAPDSLKLEFLDRNGNVRYWFTFKLCYEGWRACWIGFKSMRGTKFGNENKLSLTSCRIIAPKRKGCVYLDRWKILEKNMNLRTTPDMQIEYNALSTGSALWHWCRVWLWEKYEYDFPYPEKITKKQSEDLLAIEKNLDKSFALPTNVETQINSAKKTFIKANIKAHEKGYAGTPIVAPDEQDKSKGEMSWNDIETMLTGFAYEALCKKSKDAEKNYFTVWEYAMNQGFSYGSGMGTNHHYGYQVRKIYTSAWLMRDKIRSYKNADNIIKTLVFWSALQETRKPCPEIREELLDSWNTLLDAKIISAMILKDPKDRVRELEGLSRWVEGSVIYTPGTSGGIKIDGTTFHHGGFYPGYTTGALASVAKYISYTSGTDFVPNSDARKRLANAFRTMRNYCNLLDWGIGISGRHPFNGRMGTADIQSFAQLSIAGDLSGQGNEIDNELAADYLRLIDGKNTDEAKLFKDRGIKPAPAPHGFFVYNYGATGIFRRKNWMVTLKGYNTNVWGAEIYTKDNRYGRYQSYGSVQIMGNKSRLESGFDENGWDWNRMPGTTTIHLPLDLLENPRTGTLMAKSPEDYAGASSLEGYNGMFSMKLAEANYKNFTPDFVAKKSVFCFNNHMVCLGTGISNSNKDYPTETTIFQSAFKGEDTAIKINGKKIASLPFECEIKGGKDCWISDGYGNQYQIMEGDIKVCIAEQESRNEKNKSHNKGKQASAYIMHDYAPKNASYEYCVWIQPSEEELKKASKKAVYSILKKDNTAHIIKDYETGITAYSAFEDTNIEWKNEISFIKAETMVMLRMKTKNCMVISICDPNLNIMEKTYSTAEPSAPIKKKIVLNGKWELEKENENVKISTSSGKTELTVTCQHGIPVEVCLRK